jgi:succinyl-CoA synthetase beta subunit
MATMDIIKLAGGSPANFLDVGGGANAEQIKNAFRILMADADVKAVFINIFGGILRCDVLAEGVIAAVRDLGVKVPVVVRMKGNNEARGKEMLLASGFSFATADDMTLAARKVVAAASGLPMPKEPAKSPPAKSPGEGGFIPPKRSGARGAQQVSRRAMRPPASGRKGGGR